MNDAWNLLNSALQDVVDRKYSVNFIIAEAEIWQIFISEEFLGKYKSEILQKYPEASKNPNPEIIFFNNYQLVLDPGLKGVACYTKITK